MSDDLSRIIYLSRNAIAGSHQTLAAEIDNILAVSRRNNQAAGVTGALLFSRDCFAQLLEGPRPVIEDLFERIVPDPRHADVTLLEIAEVGSRIFPDWSMRYAGMIEDEAMTFAKLSAAPDEGAATVLQRLQDLVRLDVPRFAY